MTELVTYYRNLLQAKEYRKDRMQERIDFSDLVIAYDKYDPRISTVRFAEMMKKEKVVLYPQDRFGFHRTQQHLPIFFDQSGKKRHLSIPGNITPNYAAVIAKGLDAIKEEITQKISDADESQALFYQCLTDSIDRIESLSDQYRMVAQEKGLADLANALATVPHKPAVTFYEACLFMHILLYSLRCYGINHTTLGRFDQYMLPYFQRDISAGRTREELLETLELFFIALNLDTDTYFGIQQGDNGQSMVLGGFDKHGNEMFNDLSMLCMEASLEMKLIDPKINLRCGKKTPQWLYEYATKMTRQGLGFPQYCNDDVVVPGLVALEYDYEDALDYTVAACWEYIIPNKSFDVPNIATFNFPLIIHQAITQNLLASNTFDDLMSFVKLAITKECDRLVSLYISKRYSRVPLLSMMVNGCLESGHDISDWGTVKYSNYGCHGAGIANAADALMAVKETVFEKRTISKEALLQALEADFIGYSDIQHTLLNCPKMGNHEDCVDQIACDLMEIFSTKLNGTPNGNGGIWRAGTGSAMEYILCAQKCPATADGRNAYEPYGSSFSPAITTKLNGPLSLIQSFTKFDMKKIINGGPLTMELHDSVFRNEEGEKKVAQLVRAFIELGGHQLQLNSINRDTLLDAQKHPEKYPNLIVRVWGWSGYFCELDPEYQNHIIRRTEFTL